MVYDDNDEYFPEIEKNPNNSNTTFRKKKIENWKVPDQNGMYGFK